MTMNIYKVIKGPHITEQSSILNQELKQIVFKVDPRACKREIKNAVESLFEVKVEKVTTSLQKGKTIQKQLGNFKEAKSNFKKAYVTLSKDSDIQFEGVG